ncbi:MAG: 16S rRNA (guanine(966)-N(2))-methyltransferase RsmD [Anaerorhabdus sp.]
MRVISGKYRSRVLSTLDGDGTRPTLSKVKEAVFSMAGTFFDGGFALDLFSGSANIGIEALSRGFESCVFVDSNPKAVRVISKNLDNLKIENQFVWNLDYIDALNKARDLNYIFDFIYIDPPYDKLIIEEILKYITNNNLISDGGLIFCERLKNDLAVYNIDELVLKKQKTYGTVEILMYKKEK